MKISDISVQRGNFILSQIIDRILAQTGRFCPCVQLHHKTLDKTNALGYVLVLQAWHGAVKHLC